MISLLAVVMIILASCLAAERNRLLIMKQSKCYILSSRLKEYYLLIIDDR